MSKRVCQHCGKGILRGHKVSHAKQRTKKISKPNLHWQRVVVVVKSAKGRPSSGRKRLLLCTRCTKLLKKKAKAETKSPKPEVGKN